ncbi:MAG: fibrobacter succinogenes major paralogous domain-containing protein [Flavobacteriales bacterium]|nr:fibrobacter succinogenes major paralogous domain-containing protein [Flavobacteriales bacterium]
MRFNTLFATAMLASAQLSAQSITLTFNATLNGSNWPLDSVWVRNVTQGADTLIVAPNNVLFLGTVGISDPGGAEFRMQAAPNPYGDEAMITFTTLMSGPATVSVHDVAGRDLAHFARVLPAGAHRMRLHGGGEQMLLVTVTQGAQRQALRLISNEATSSAPVQLHYEGVAGYPKGGGAGWAWAPGDELRYIGYGAAAGLVKSAVITEAPDASITHTFALLAGAACRQAPTMTDLDGNVYRAVEVDGVCWSAEELRTTKYANGDAVAAVSDASTWIATTSGAVCSYNNSASNDATTGKRYNWFAASDARGLCPLGWHVATDLEWKDLESALGMPASELDGMGFIRGAAQNVGGKMKSLQTWNSPNTGATDETGLGLRGSGQRSGIGGGFSGISTAGYWWSSTDNGAEALFRTMITSSGGIVRDDFPKQNGFCVRCVLD